MTVAFVTPSSPRDFIRWLERIGLTTKTQTSSGGHTRVYDTNSGVWLFDVSNSPSDQNWFHHARRILVKAGIVAPGGSQSIKSKTRRKYVGAIDLEALKRAQDAAAASGERIPQISDLDTMPELLKKSPAHMYTEEATEEAISNMKTASPATNHSKDRFKRFMEINRQKLIDSKEARGVHGGGSAQGDGSLAEFARIMIEEGNRRGMRVPPTHSAAAQIVKRFNDNDPKYIPPVWVRNLVEATMDHVEGLRFDVAPPEIPEIQQEVIPPIQDKSHGYIKTIEVKVEPEPEPDPDPVDFIPVMDMRQRYANLLLEMLASAKPEYWEVIMVRLDQIADITSPNWTDES